MDHRTARRDANSCDEASSRDQSGPHPTGAQCPEGGRGSCRVSEGGDSWSGVAETELSLVFDEI